MPTFARFKCLADRGRRGCGGGCRSWCIITVRYQPKAPAGQRWWRPHSSGIRPAQTDGSASLLKRTRSSPSSPELSWSPEIGRGLELTPSGSSRAAAAPGIVAETASSCSVRQADRGASGKSHPLESQQPSRLSAVARAESAAGSQHSHGLIAAAQLISHLEGAELDPSILTCLFCDLFHVALRL
jgi:hypothetical protein